MLQVQKAVSAHMLRLTNLHSSQCRRWCTAIVLLAVCALTVSVATRYSHYPTTPRSVAKTIHKLTSQQPRCQRLLKNAAVWIPPAVSSHVLLPRRSSSHVTPAEPVLANLVFEKSLYNRPPPSVEFP